MKHTCHATDCEREVPPSMLMCRAHWAMLPPQRFPVIRNYRRGQCDDKRPSADWVKAARAAIAYVEAEAKRRADG